MKNKILLFEFLDYFKVRKKYWLLPTITMLMFFSLFANISAFDFDNVAYYENNDLNVKITNAFGFGSELLEADLKSHNSIDEIKGVPLGHDVPVMWYDINSTDGYVGGLGDVQFTNMENGKPRDLPYYFAEVVPGDVEVPTQICNPFTNSSGTFQKCSESTKIEIGDTYKKLDTRDIPSGTHRIALMTYVGYQETIDGVWTLAGEQISKHASWSNYTGGFSVTSAGSSTPGQLAINYSQPVSNYYVPDSIDNWVYCFNSTGQNQTNCGFSTTNAFPLGAPEGLLLLRNNFYLTSRDAKTISRLNLDGTNTTGAFNINACVVAGDTRPRGITTQNGTDLWVVTIKNIVCHFDLQGKNLTGSFNLSAGAPLMDPTGIAGQNGSEFIVTPYSPAWAFHFDKNGINKTDGFPYSTFANPTGHMRGAAWSNYTNLLYISGGTGEIYILNNSDASVNLDNPPTITLNTPTNNTNQISTSIILNVTATDDFIVENVTINMTYPNGSSTFSRTTNGITNATNFTYSLSSLPYGIYNWTGRVYDNKSQLKNSKLFWFNISIFLENNFTYNSLSFETKNETFELNVSSLSTISNTKFIYNGTSYSISSSNPQTNNYTLRTTIDVPLINGTKSFLFNLTINGIEYSSLSNNQLVNQTNFYLCNTSATTEFLNLTFKDESTLNYINASIPTSSFQGWLGSGAINKSVSFINNTDNLNYNFCGQPNQTIYVDSSVQYKQGTTYPQRIWNPPTQSYNQTMREQILYLLSTTEGQFVTFQVLNNAGQSLEGVSVNATREISGSNVEVASGTTDAAGSVTFFLNPDFSHTFVFKKTGLSNFVYVTFPTQTSYTVTMGGGSASVPQDFTQGVSYSISPTNDFLYQNITQNFSFTISSTHWSLDFFGANLTYGNGTVIGSSSSTVVSGGTISFLNVKTYTQQNITMSPYYVINSTTINVTQRIWILQNASETDFSIYHFFTDLTLYTSSGSGFFGFDNFGRSLLAFVIIVVVVGGLSQRYGLASEPAIMGIIFGLVFFFDVGVGLIPRIQMGNFQAAENFITYLTALILIAFIIREERG